MPRGFDEHPFLSGLTKPCRMEVDAPDLQIEGEWPRDLAGSFYRNGPDLLYPPRDDDYHWFDGDGMVFAFHMEDGKVSLVNRWVRTEKWLAEKAAGRKLFGTFGNPATSDMETLGDTPYTAANTHVMAHAGKLYALWEAGYPMELDPITLETKGPDKLEGKMGATFTAHPHIDFRTGEMITFGAHARGIGSPHVRYGVIDSTGKVTASAEFEAPYASLMHDFYVTENWVIFPVFPLSINVERAQKGLPVNAWDTSLHTHFGLMPRSGDVDKMVWFEMDPRHSYHVYNAWEEQGPNGPEIVAVVASGDRAPLFPDLQGNMPSHQDSKFWLHRWRFPLDGSTNAIKEEKLSDADTQFPRPDDRHFCYKTRHVFCNSNLHSDVGRTDGMDSVYRLDLETGKEDRCDLGKGNAVGEVVVAPRNGATEECDGYVLGITYDHETDTSALSCFDPLNLAAGPIARAKVPFRIPAGFHVWYEPSAS